MLDRNLIRMTAFNVNEVTTEVKTFILQYGNIDFHKRVQEWLNGNDEDFSSYDGNCLILNNVLYIYEYQNNINCVIESESTIEWDDKMKFKDMVELNDFLISIGCLVHYYGGTKYISFKGNVFKIYTGKKRIILLSKACNTLTPNKYYGE